MLVPRLGQHGCSLLRNETWSGVLVAGGVNSESLLANAEVKYSQQSNESFNGWKVFAALILGV